MSQTRVGLQSISTWDFAYNIILLMRFKLKIAILV